MARPRAWARPSLCRLPLLIAATGVAIFAPAYAQEEKDLLFLKPGFEDPPPAEPPAAPAEEPATPVEPPAAEGAPAADTTPDAAAPTEAAGQGSQALRFAVLAGRSAADTLNAVGPLAERLGELLGRPVEILPVATWDAMIDAQEQRRIDGGFFSAAAFALTQSRCRCLEPIVAPRASDGTLAYHAIIVVRGESGIGSTADLKGRTVAVASADSFGARRMQLAGLLAEGNDPATLFGAVLAVPSAEEAVRLVATGAADAAFAWSSLSGPPETGYSRGTLTDLVARGEIVMSQMAVVWRSAPITHGPFAVLQSLPDRDKAAIEAYLLELETADPVAYDTLNPFYAGGYAAVDAPDYAGLAALTAWNVGALTLPAPPATGAILPEPSEPPPAAVEP